MNGRRRLHVDGVVQGVGFRPFVFNLAESLGLSGWVSNSSAGVFVEVEGPPDALDSFRRRLEGDAPPLARIVSVTESLLPPDGGAGFAILPSEDSPGTSTLVPADAAVCADCLGEIRDPDDRRCSYPFINCTHCGPRWTIIDRIPYDRAFTSMAPFTMCERCRAEYEDPRDRRFHAQPNACADCGPRVWLEGDGIADAGPPLEAAARLLADGRILAIKGLGGFHLAVRADDEAAVVRLRVRKGREAKPLAVMVADLDGIRELAAPTDDEIAALRSPEAPIVLVARQNDRLAAAVAPGHRRLGVMLPYTPLHHLLFDALAPHGVGCLVMTSGNAGDEPICLENDEALARLAGIADAWLLHDRGILRRADDSVVQCLDDGPLFFRRSRGFAPLPVIVRGSRASGPTVLAAGAELKNAVGLLKGDRCFLSPHVGDLENLATHDFFRETVRTLTALLECEPEALACDRHPGYHSSRWAREEAARRGLPLVEVQHHHAHMVATMAEHGLDGPVVGLILDGTGYGDDGTIWGGEILAGDAAGYRRLGCLEPLPLPGGDAAVRAPWRTAVGLLQAIHGDDLPDLPWLRDRPVGAVLEMIAKGVNTPRTSSCGRLFDAAAALTGRWSEVGYEAQAAVQFTALTTLEEARGAPSVPVVIDQVGELLILRSIPLVSGSTHLRDIPSNSHAFAAAFHRSLADLLVEATASIARREGLRDIVLGGGSFQNEILLTLVSEGLTRWGLVVHRPIQLSPNDGGLALGQAVIARASL